MFRKREGRSEPFTSSAQACPTKNRAASLALRPFEPDPHPFGELSLEERGKLTVCDLELFIPSLSQPGFALQILGECGRGKTSRLLALRRHFPAAAYIHYPENGPRPAVPAAPLLFLDEAQRFKPRELRSILKQKASFVIGTHTDHSRLFKSLGLKHHTVLLKGLSPERLGEVLRLRIEAARRGPDPVPYLGTEAVRNLIQTFGDDIRAVEHHLYEIFQTLETIGPVKIDAASPSRSTRFIPSPLRTTSCCGDLTFLLTPKVFSTGHMIIL